MTILSPPYSSADSALAVVAEWLRVGGLLEVNSGSLLGRYGGRAKTTAWRLLSHGWEAYVAGDYHGRGRCHTGVAGARLKEKGGVEQAELLFHTNPARLLDSRPPAGRTVAAGAAKILLAATDE